MLTWSIVVVNEHQTDKEDICKKIQYCAMKHITYFDLDNLLKSSIN